MGELLELLCGTVILRPYVFIFLAVYLLLATWHLGLGRALVFLLVGYLLAWGSEYASIHTGFPYGPYKYLGATRGQELWVLGVPFMDSISYVFLSYASYSLSLFILSPATKQCHRFLLGENDGGVRPGETLVLASFLFMALDVVIDPVALRGYRWFLGQIYHYAEPGIYFGVPLSNFMGWFLVGAVLVLTLQLLSQGLNGYSWMTWGKRNFAGLGLLGPALYFTIVCFMLIITFYIGEAWLGLIGCLIYTPLVSLLTLKIFTCLCSDKAKGASLEAWIWPQPREEGG